MNDVKIDIILPRQRFRYQGLNILFEDVSLTFLKLGYNTTIYEISNYKNPLIKVGDVDVRAVSYENLYNILSNDNITICVDDHNFLHYLKNFGQKKKMLVWSQYLIGNKFLFQQYSRKGKLEHPNLLNNRAVYEVVPRAIWMRKISFFYKALMNRHLIAQSLWSSLLLNRVFMLNAFDTVYMPVRREIFKTSPKKESSIIFYLGNHEDTYLNDVVEILDKSLKLSDFRLISIGSEVLSMELSKKFNEKIEHYVNVPRDKYYSMLSSATLAISPVFGGTFEYFPIESLLCGTPILSYMQPFMEVTSSGDSVITIENKELAIHRIQSLLSNNNYVHDIEYKKKLIIEKMDSEKVAKQLLYNAMI